MKRGAIVLCGGQSSRMGRDKATLPFGPECMLQRVVRLLTEVVDARHLVVVAARGQTLPALPAGVTATWDHHEARGPLEALATGLQALPRSVEAAYVTGCDVPLLVPAFVDQMFSHMTDADIAVPFDGTHHYPLAAIYRRRALAAAEALLETDQRRLRSLFDVVLTREIHVATLRAIDPELRTLENLNRPEDYHAALQRAGLPLPE